MGDWRSCRMQKSRSTCVLTPAWAAPAPAAPPLLPLLQAGQVWFPDSALKTAQAIEEFGLEGLPLFILANWRGFSGGQRDLFEGVLQVGGCLVGGGMLGQGGWLRPCLCNGASSLLADPQPALPPCLLFLSLQSTPSYVNLIIHHPCRPAP